MPGPHPIRRATDADAAVIGRMLHEFNAEFGQGTPGPEAFARRIGELLAAGEAHALLAGDGPDGLAVYRLRPALWAEGLQAYLEELYVVPSLRGRGIGRALLDAVVAAAREAGAIHLDLNTAEGDVAARRLYESAGFTNVEEATDGERMLYYEREL